MITFLSTPVFSSWLKALRDSKGKARIIARLRSAELGNFGDCKALGDSLFEMRVNFGPGYRTYYARKGDVIYVLLGGGDKSTQERDIKQAKALHTSLEGQP